jgi:hypothetical protein
VDPTHSPCGINSISIAQANVGRATGTHIRINGRPSGQAGTRRAHVPALLFPVRGAAVRRSTREDWGLDLARELAENLASLSTQTSEGLSQGQMTSTQKSV